ncbi:hypothetical protein GMOD_00001422 [Pyrenophora seminiperda CCB06]|uniref:F-box domain-containing protein n=1 Tax=Pyrenophora seminiperda CCB06 TaxID=1302712 RepID=A0A3M7LZ95_9PLEO|nr:hypothetical protein GMOD_00001422 [Pyrenophora seminiperda CCB06]
MATTIPLPPPPHEPTPPNTHIPSSFLILPAELRNQVYTHLFHPVSPVIISFCHHLRDTKIPSPQPTLSFRSNTPFPVALFRTCRQMYTEASSVFYSGNEFLLYTKGVTGICFLTTVLLFLQSIGETQARRVRRVVFERINACTPVCHHRSYMYWGTPLFGTRTEEGVVEVTGLLRVFWEGGLRLGLKNYGSLVCGVAVKRDGSGGWVSWGSTPPHGMHNKAWPRYSPHTNIIFNSSPSSLDVGKTLLSIAPRPTPTLLTLPKPLRTHIINLAVFPPGESIELHVDTATKFPLGLPHVNKTFRAALWPTSLIARRYILKTCSSSPRSDFNGFSGLRQVLRKVIMYARPSDSAGVALTLGHGYPGVEEIVLEFNLEASVRFEELRISVLPLVMETREIGGGGEADVVVRVCWGSGRRDWRVGLEKLRGVVVDALRGMAVKEGGGRRDGKWELQVWVNGLGDVVDTVVEAVDIMTGGQAGGFCGSSEGVR